MGPRTATTITGERGPAATEVGVPATATGLFVRVLNEPVQAILEALAAGIRDPKSKYKDTKQDLMFFAAGRPRELGGAEVIAKRLSDLGVPGNTVDRLNQTALYFAAREGNHECATFLVEQRCDVNHRDVNGQSPLFYSVREGHVDTCKVLTLLGASSSLVDNNKKTVRHYATDDIAVALLGAGIGLGVTQGSGHPDPKGRKALRRTSASNAEKPEPKEAPPPVSNPAKETKKTETEDPLLRRRQRRLAMSSSGGTCSSEATEPSPKVRRRGRAASPAVSAASSVVAWSARPTIRPVNLPAVLTLPRDSCSEENVLSDIKMRGCGRYRVQVPTMRDVVRLRELEREFVVDHYDLFRSDDWHENLVPTDWCRLVNVIFNEEMALQAIASIVLGRTPDHVTLECVYTPLIHASTEESRRVVGYVHFVRDADVLDISHLKVDRSHQRLGLGRLLIAGCVRYALRAQWEVQGLRLVAVEKNGPAVNLYHKLGFEDVESVQKQVRKGAGLAEWRKMWRPLSEEAPEDFATACETRSRPAVSTEIPPHPTSFPQA